MHNIIVYLSNLNFWFILYATRFGNNFAIIKGGYIKLRKRVCLKI
jgi:hypothetical protein